MAFAPSGPFDRLLLLIQPKPPTATEIASGQRLPHGISRKDVNGAIERLLYLSERPFAGLEEDGARFTGFSRFIGLAALEKYVPDTLVETKKLADFDKAVKRDYNRLSDMTQAGVNYVVIPDAIIKAYQFEPPQRGIEIDGRTDFDVQTMMKTPIRASPLLDARAFGNKIPIHDLISMTAAVSGEFDKALAALPIGLRPAQKRAGPTH